jgi:glycosidase
LLALSSFSFASGQATTNARVGLGSDLIYFVMPDRYKDGDPSNDNNGGFDPTNTAFYHGGDLKGLTGTCSPGDDGLARIKSLGFTAVWVTPLVTQQPASSHGAGYHGYWGVDFVNVDPHLGTHQDLIDFAACAKKLKLKLILDIVTNHTGDVIQYSGHDAYIPPGSENAKNPAWLNDITNYHNVGDLSHCWGDGDCLKIGDFGGLDDLATEKEVVWRGWADVYGQWIKDMGLAGFRVDTARHVDDNFFKNWQPLIQATAKSAGINNFTIFGEVYQFSPIEIMTYVRENKIQTLLDFPFQQSATDFASGLADGAALGKFFLNDDYYTSETSSAGNLVTFLGNHDMGRAGFIIASKKEQPASQLLARTELAHALMYLSRGIPSVYYGDEVGITGTGSGNDQLARQDMFPTQIDMWKTEPRIGSDPVGTGDSFALTAANPIAKYLKTLALLRSQNPGLANEVMQPRYSNNSLFIVSKKDAKEKREYVVAFNNSAKAQSVEITTATSSGGWKTLLGKSSISAKGAKVTFSVPALSTLVFKANKPIDQVGVKTGKIKVSEDYLTGYFHAVAGLTTNDLLSVEFSVKSASTGTWSSVGVDTNAPYSVYLNPQDYSGQTIEIKAVATNSKGATFALPSATFTVPAS